MKTSDLIAQLQHRLVQNGDLEVQLLTEASWKLFQLHEVTISVDIEEPSPDTLVLSSLLTPTLNEG